MPNDMIRITVTLLGIELSFRTDSYELIDFIDVFSGMKTVKNTKGRPHIVVNFGSGTNIQIDKTFKKISRTIWLKDSCVYLSDIERFPGLRLKASLAGETLIIDADYRKKSSALHRIVSMSRRNRQTSLFNLGIVYYLIYFPILYYMEHFRGRYLLHAGAIEYKQKGVILSGLGGVGKSTFIISSLFMHGIRILSDNLIFYDLNKVFPFPEPVALNRDNLVFPGDIDKILIAKNLATTHGRSLYAPKPELRCPKASPTHLLWLQWGAENRVVPIAREELKQKLLLINLLAKELREYYILAASFDLAFSLTIPQSKYDDAMSRLLSDVDCRLLIFKPNMDMKTVMEETLAKVLD